MKTTFLLVLFLFAAVSLGQVYLRASGPDFFYGSQTVLLKGVNFDNVPALAASIGTGRPTRVSHTSTYSKLPSLLSDG